jgi:SpoVK/Ycf46/Vps4 family AAA+-type ATPase
MNAYVITPKKNSNFNFGPFLQSLAGGTVSTMVQLIPIFALIGFMDGRGEANVYSRLSDGSYSQIAQLSWLPFVLTAFLAQLLTHNRGWLQSKFSSNAEDHNSQIKICMTELLLAVTLALCAAWMGSIFGNVWQVRHGFGAVIVVLTMVFLLSAIYGFVAFTQRKSGASAIDEGGMEKEENEFEVDDSVESYEAHSSENLRSEEPQSPERFFPHVADNTEQSLLNSAALAKEIECSYSFQWERPTDGFESLAGMQVLKLELMSAIKRFQHYRNIPGVGRRALQNGSVGMLATQGNSTKFGNIGIADQNGILLSGPPGSGKTAFASAIAAELGLPFVKLGCGDLTSKWVNESSAVIKELFRQANLQPCVLFFDEFEGVAMSRSAGNMHGEDRKVVNTLLAEIDSARKAPILIIAASNFVEMIDVAIARPGRFDFRVDIPYPDLEARIAIIRALLDKHQIIVDRVTLERVAKLWTLRSIAFIDSTIKRVREIVTDRDGFRAFMEDFKFAARAVSRKSSALPAEGPTLAEITLTSVVRHAANSLLFRLRNWEKIEERGGELPTGVLLYGPPGTGKTMFVKALARELGDWHVFEICASDINQRPKAFRETVELAMNHRPAIVFIDEADEVLANRTGSWNAGTTNEILKCMDGFGGKAQEVVFICSTNRVEGLDPAALRGGRFGERIKFNELEGVELLNFVHCQIQKMTQVQFGADVSAEAITKLLRKASPADVVSFLRRAVNASFGITGDKSDVISMEMLRCEYMLLTAEKLTMM